MERYRLGVSGCVVLLLVFGAIAPLTTGEATVRDSAPLPNQSAQQPADNATHVRNLTIEQLSLIDVTLTNTTIARLEIRNVTRDGESPTNRTMENVSARTLFVNNAVLLNVSLNNVTIRNDSVAEALLSSRPTANRSIDNSTFEKLTLEGVVVLENLTVRGAAIETVVVANATLPDVVGKTEPVRKQANTTPVLEIGSATIVKFRGAVLGDQTPTETTTTTATTRRANETTTV